MTVQSLQAPLDLLLKTGSLLISCGCSSNRTELLLEKLAQIFGLQAEIFAMPTGLTAVVQEGSNRLSGLSRVRNWSIDLDRIDRINQLIINLTQKTITLEQAEQAIKACAEGKQPYPKWLVYLGQGMASFGLIFFLGGSTFDCVAGFGISLLGSIVYGIAVNFESSRYLADFLVSMLVSCSASLVQMIHPQSDMPKVVVGAIVIMLPGLVLVNSFHELAQKNLVSGAAKVFEAAIIGLSLWFGVSFGLEITGLLTTIFEKAPSWIM